MILEMLVWPLVRDVMCNVRVRSILSCSVHPSTLVYVSVLLVRQPYQQNCSANVIAYDGWKGGESVAKVFHSPRYERVRSGDEESNGRMEWRQQEDSKQQMTV